MRQIKTAYLAQGFKALVLELFFLQFVCAALTAAAGQGCYPVVGGVRGTVRRRREMEEEHGNTRGSIRSCPQGCQLENGINGAHPIIPSAAATAA